jgi:hypothetical protein
MVSLRRSVRRHAGSKLSSFDATGVLSVWQRPAGHVLSASVTSCLHVRRVTRTEAIDDDK